MRNQAVATAFSLLLRFVWECVKMASNKIYVNAQDKLQQGDLSPCCNLSFVFT